MPQLFADVDRDKVLKQGVDLSVGLQDAAGVHGRRLRQLLQPLRTRLAGVRAGRGRVPHAGAENVGQFYVRNAKGDPVPLSALVTMRPAYGPEFTMRFNEYRAAQINVVLAPGYSSEQVMAALEEVFAETMPREMGFDYMGMSFQEQVAAQGVPASVIFGFSLLMVFLHPGGAVRELDAALQRPARRADRRLRRLRGALAARASTTTSSRRSASSC